MAVRIPPKAFVRAYNVLAVMALRTICNVNGVMHIRAICNVVTRLVVRNPTTHRNVRSLDAQVTTSLITLFILHPQRGRMAMSGSSPSSSSVSSAESPAGELRLLLGRPRYADLTPDPHVIERLMTRTGCNESHARRFYCRAKGDKNLACTHPRFRKGH